MMGLRLAEGVPLERIVAETGRPLDSWIPPARLRAAAEQGLLQRGPQRLAATAEGRQRLDALLGYLLA